MLYCCDKFREIEVEDTRKPIITHISPVLGLPKYLGEEISIHLVINDIGSSNKVFDKTFTAIQDGEVLRWSDTTGPAQRFEYSFDPYDIQGISFSFTENYISGWGNRDTYYYKVTEFSINGIPVTQRE